MSGRHTLLGVLTVAVGIVGAGCEEQRTATSTIITEPPLDTTDSTATGPDTSDSTPVTDPSATTSTMAPRTTAQPEIVPTTTLPPDTLPPDTLPPDTLPPVTSTVAGVAVAGNSGGVGPDQTDSFSEAVRNDDGTCSGWAGPGGGAWTAGLEVGAPVAILDRDTGATIGTGSIVAGSFVDVDPTGREQWVCNFEFAATVTGAPAEFRVAVADLEPWLARPDPTRPGQFVTSVNTVADPNVFSQCTDDDVGDVGDVVTAWTSAGLYWSNGISSICSNGLRVEALDRPCRPPDIGSDHVISVVRADDQSVVLEDTSGLLVDPATLEPGTAVVVRIATGRPCG